MLLIGKRGQYDRSSRDSMEDRLLLGQVKCT